MSLLNLYLLFYKSWQEVEKYKLGNPKSFHYLNQSNCYELVGVSDARDYLNTRRAMDIVGISEKEQVRPSFDSTFSIYGCMFSFLPMKLQKTTRIYRSLCQDAIFRIVAAILHLGNIEFAKGKEIDSSIPKDDKSKFHLQMTAELLMYDWIHKLPSNSMYCNDAWYLVCIDDIVL